MHGTMNLTPNAPSQPTPLMPNGVSSVNGSGGRKRVSQACKPCGIKKVKCDGVFPACGMCIQRRVECEYGESKRKNRHRHTASPGSRSSLPPPSYISRPREESLRLTPASHEYPANQQPLRHGGPRVNKSGGLSTIQPELSTRLFQNYFHFIHPLWPILYKPFYASIDYGNPTKMMPPELVAAIFAIAACIESKPQNTAANCIVQRCPEPDTFVNEAAGLMQYDEVTNSPMPTITNCQILTILALQQHGVAEYSRAVILCGTACAIAIEMGLRRPDTSGDPIQVEVRSRLWWNLYILEKIMSCEMGKPVLLRAETTDCPMPSTSEADEFELMFTYTNDQGSSAPAHNTSVKLQTISGLHTTISLSIIMERVSREIYDLSARRAIRTDQQTGEAKRMELWSDLRVWERHVEKGPLRLDLSSSLPSVPVTITNHVIMYHGTILLHRPFIARWNPSVSENTSSPLSICLVAANNICLILEKHFDRLPGLPCDMVFSVFTAASMLLYHSKQSGSEGEFETRRRLKLCIHWLGVLGKGWKTAGARHRLLNDMYDLPSDMKPNGNNNLPPGQLPLPKIQSPTSYIQPTPPLKHAPQFQPPGPIPFTAINAPPHTSCATQIHDPQNSTPHIPQTPYPPLPQQVQPQIQQQYQQPQQYQKPEDWNFLQSFGDATDEFYAFDVELRGLLDSPDFLSGSSGFI